MSSPELTSLQIDTVEVPGAPGLLGLCACPGTRRTRLMGHESTELLKRDLDAIRDIGAAGLVTLVESHEVAMLGLSTVPDELAGMGLWWKHLPITDMGVPGEDFEAAWAGHADDIHSALDRGAHVVLHCWAGLGRTGTIAARLLIERGMEPEAAVLRVRTARPGSIQTRRQHKYVLRLSPGVG